METSILIRRLLGVALGLLGAGATGRAIDVVQSPQELKQLDLEQLLQTKVLSVSRTLEDWTTAPTAIGLLTAEEIRHTGAVRLAEALRFAPGLNVERYVGSSYAIGARGFNSASVNKMQVLLDGRSLYTPLFSGVFWEVQDAMLEDLDRIEVVRGPGATLWGADAVNGVINIVSKNAKETQGGLVSAGGGSDERAFANVRYGGQVGATTFYRVYYKYLERDAQELRSGSSAADGMKQGQGGFRIDTTQPGDNVLTLQGDAYANRFEIPGRTDAKNLGGNLLGRWTHTFTDQSEMQTQVYYDRNYRNVPLQFREDRETYDFEIQHHLRIAGQHDVVMGLNYQTSTDDTGPGGTFIFAPPARSLDLLSGFIQDEIDLDSHVTLSLGSKFEHNDYTGFEVQPSARLAYAPTARDTLWLGVSRAVRTPTRADTDSRFIPVPATKAVFIQGNPEFRSEDLVAYEAGYRFHPSRRLFLDVATYYNVYNHLRTLEPTLPTGLPLVVSNERKGDTYGAEVSATFQPTAWWQLVANYTYLQKDLRFLPGSHDPTAGSLEADDPRHYGSLRSSLALPHEVDFDVAVRFATRLPNPASPGYVGVDVRLAFHPVKDVELSVVGLNLCDPRHPEFASGSPSQPEIPRSVHGQVTWRF